ncbi:MAG: DUF4037 domain-containing protein [Desulfovibrio sp.]|jgi:hypothetical protein|nr:DUF4037 domain-containing protein [Desulfovibrio sp.]
MKGLELAALYYKERCFPMLRAFFPGLARRVAAGLVGEGSECLGFDDEISRDHDWGPAICLWLNKRDFNKYGEALRLALDALPPFFRGFPVRRPGRWSEGRTGVMEMESFYSKFLGQANVPEKPVEWMAISDAQLAAATNGEVFADPGGEFTRIRKKLLAFYPEDVRRKKLAAHCAKVAQAGQYNFPRCAARGEYVAAALAEAVFIEAACSAVFLLNRRYAPFYKWLHRALKALPVMGPDMYARLCALAETEEPPDRRAGGKKRAIIEDVSRLIADELRRQGLSAVENDFLLDHAFAVQNGIQDEYLRNLNVFLGA